MKKRLVLGFAMGTIASLFFDLGLLLGAEPKGKGEWEGVLAEAKKEGKLVAGIPASAELRKSIEEAFRKRFPGIELELFPGRGPTNANRIVAEYRAGVRAFDLLLSGTATPFTMLNMGVIDPTEPYLILPDVKNPDNWWGGHMWIDNAKRFVYMFQAYQTENQWHNTQLLKPEEVRSYDDLLQPKWKGKIGYLDPRTPGSGTATWAFLWKHKGEDYLKRLSQQDLYLTTDQRQLADSLAKGKLAVVIGITYYTMLPHVEARLPVRPLPALREGQYTTPGSGALSIIKNGPHPNAAKLFVNWLLSREGQEIYGKAMGQATRRLDVDTKWLTKAGVKASKDFISLEEHLRLENYGEDTVVKIWEPATEFAKKLLR